MKRLRADNERLVDEREQLMQRLYTADQEKRELGDNFAYVKEELDKWQKQQSSSEPVSAMETKTN